MRPLNLPLATEEINLLAVLRALRRHVPLILGTVLAVNVVSVGAVMLIPPRYNATAMVMIDPADPRVLQIPSVAKSLPDWVVGDNSVMTTQINVLKSPELVARVIDALGLQKDPELQPGMSLLGQVRGWVSNLWIGAALSPWLPAPAPAGRQAELEAMVHRFLARLSVGQQGNSRMISISYTSRDPAHAALVANGVARQYIESQVAYKTEVTERAYRWVSERVAEQRRQLETAENDVAKYMAANGLVRTPTGAVDAQQLSGLQAELVAARADRAAKEARLAQLREREAGRGGYESLPEVGSSRIIEVLQQQAAAVHAQEAKRLATYGPNHPAVLEAQAQSQNIDQRISQEAANIARGIADDAARARIRVKAMEQTLAGSKEQYAGSERAMVGLNELSRVAAAKSAMYQTMLGRLAEIGEQRGLIEPDARLMVPAVVPQDRAFPKIGIILGSGFAGSLILGIGLAAVAEHMDRGLRTPRQVEQMLGLQNLALVPRVRRTRRLGQPHNHMLSRPQSAYAEAIRALYLGIERACERGPVQVLMITSTWPGEGKTTLAISLGAMLARCGRRVVVVDLDLRNPSVAQALGCPVNAGLLEYVERGDRLDDVVQTAPGEMLLNVIATRAPVANPADVLGSARLRELIVELRERYDTVVLDLPPALGVTDVLAIAALADAALFVVRWGTTTDAAAVNAITALEKAGIEIVGCVLTQVDLQQHALYSYHDAGEYYHRHHQYFLE